jgi:hypothetical protein
LIGSGEVAASAILSASFIIQRKEGRVALRGIYSDGGNREFN